MRQRFERQSIREMTTGPHAALDPTDLHYRFVQAIPRNSSYIDLMAKDADSPVEKMTYDDMTIVQCRTKKEELNRQTRGTYSCLYSHLHAIRQFAMYGTGDYAIICEDDVHLHKDFKSLLGYIWPIVERLKPDTLSLGYLFRPTEEDKAQAGSDYTIMRMSSRDVWGTQMYLISKTYALKLLERFDRPAKYFGNYFPAADLIITRSLNSFFLYPPLAVEEKGPSTTAGVFDEFHQSVYDHLYDPDLYE